jgi:hypothetical protein
VKSGATAVIHHIAVAVFDRFTVATDLGGGHNVVDLLDLSGLAIGSLDGQ